MELVKVICDHLSGCLTHYGRPDPDRTRFATQAPWRDLVGGPTLHSVPQVALALYKAGRQLKCPAYTRGADVSVLYMMGVTRDPYGGERDLYCKYVAEFIQKVTGDDARNQAVHVMSRCWMPAISLDILCRGFLQEYPGETSFVAKAAALYEWTLHHRTDRGPYFRIGYTPSGVSGEGVDGAFSDDLAWVGRGLASYYAFSRREEVLNDLVGLSRYYVTAHKADSDEGCFDDEAGAWVICPWPIEIGAEHFDGKQRADQLHWGFSNRSATDFLVRLHGWVKDEALKEQLRDRLTRAMKWNFDACQHPDGGVGMMGRDDAFCGMAGAAVSNYLDCRDAGLLDEHDTAEYGQKARRAMDWILSWSADEMIDQGGHREVNGGITLTPPENMGWLLAWTSDALLRSDDVPAATE